MRNECLTRPGKERLRFPPCANSLDSFSPSSNRGEHSRPRAEFSPIRAETRVRQMRGNAYRWPTDEEGIAWGFDFARHAGVVLSGIRGLLGRGNKSELKAKYLQRIVEQVGSIPIDEVLKATKIISPQKPPRSSTRPSRGRRGWSTGAWRWITRTTPFTPKHQFPVNRSRNMPSIHGILPIRRELFSPWRSNPSDEGGEITPPLRGSGFPRGKPDRGQALGRRPIWWGDMPQKKLPPPVRLRACALSSLTPPQGGSGSSSFISCQSPSRGE